MQTKELDYFYGTDKPSCTIKYWNWSSCWCRSQAFQEPQEISWAKWGKKKIKRALKCFRPPKLEVRAESRIPPSPPPPGPDSHRRVPSRVVVKNSPRKKGQSKVVVVSFSWPPFPFSGSAIGVRELFWQIQTSSISCFLASRRVYPISGNSAWNYFE